MKPSDRIAEMFKDFCQQKLELNRSTRSPKETEALELLSLITGSALWSDEEELKSIQKGPHMLLMAIIQYLDEEKDSSKES